MANNKKILDDDNIRNLVSQDVHEKDITDLSVRLAELEKKYGSDTKLANTLFDSSKEATKINTMIENVLICLIQKDNNVREELKKFIDSSDRKYVSSQFKRWGGALGTLVALILGAVLKTLSDKYLK